MDRSKFRPTELRIVDLLKDGMPHSKAELIACLWDEMGTIETVQVHLTKIRKVLRPIGQDILVEYLPPGRRMHYRHVRLINSST